MFRLTLPALFLAAALAAAQQPTREQKVRDDKQKIEAEGFWIYNDVPKALAEGKKTGKPVLVVLRCLPCVECVKLDDDLIQQDPRVKAMLGQFVCARQVSTNGLDLGLFQYDTDQSWACFLLNGDGTVYGRFGTRSHRTNWVGDVSIDGLAKAMEGALELHKNYPANKAALAAKRGPAPEVASPEKFPSLKDKYTAALNYQGNLMQSCIHCHQIGDARRAFYRSQGKPIPEEVLFPFPHPKALGLVLDPKERATVKEVTAGSPAEQAGFKPGDAIQTLGGQPLLSIADVQWVLHHAAQAGAAVKAQVDRGGKPADVTLTLPAGWRRLDDISWRASTWPMRGMVLGGMVLEAVPGEKGPALRVKSVGQYGKHAAAKNAGVRPGDVLAEYAGKSDFRTEADVIAYAVNGHKVGEKVALKLVREGKPVTVNLPIQD